MSMHKVIAVTPLKGYRLLLAFENDEQKVIDLSKELSGVFEYLKAPVQFDMVTLVRGAPTWFPSQGLEIDLCPDALYIDGVPYGDATA